MTNKEAYKNTLKELEKAVAEFDKELKKFKIPQNLPLTVTRKTYSNRLFKIDNYQQQVKNILERLGSSN